MRSARHGAGCTCVGLAAQSETAAWLAEIEVAARNEGCALRLNAEAAASLANDDTTCRFFRTADLSATASHRDDALRHAASIVTKYFTPARGGAAAGPGGPDTGTDPDVPPTLAPGTVVSAIARAIESVREAQTWLDGILAALRHKHKGLRVELAAGAAAALVRDRRVFEFLVTVMVLPTYFDYPNRNETDVVIARLELHVAARVPFTHDFLKLCDVHAETVAAADPIQPPTHRPGSRGGPHDTTTGSRGSHATALRSFGLFRRGPGAGADADATATSIGDGSLDDASPSWAMRELAREVHRPPAPAVNIIQVLGRVTGLTIRIIEARLDFGLPRSPLLTLWYALPGAGDKGDAADVWVLPPTPTARYEYAFDFSATHPVPSAEAVLGMVRSAIPIVAFDSEEMDPTVTWAVASLDLSPLLDSPDDSVNAAVPLIASADGRHVGALRVSAEFAFGKHPRPPPKPANT